AGSGRWLRAGPTARAADMGAGLPVRRIVWPGAPPEPARIPPRRAPMSAGRPPWRRRGAQPSFLGDLRAVLAERDFRRLFATRLISQAGDGMFSGGLGGQLFFFATRLPPPCPPTPAPPPAPSPPLFSAVPAGRAVRRRVHRPLVTAADPALVRPAAGQFRGPDRLPGGLRPPGAAAVRQCPGGARRQQVLPV